ncbi:MAG: hypothetical protein UD936_09970 [Acutalibacteraceae bacterium]|nr:hypothetical protein [Acutalibacteraceae bacterium]
MKKSELILFYEYFTSRINKLENDYIQMNNNMRRKDYMYCDELDFLELMLIKKQLQYTIQMFYELKILLNIR